MPGEGAVTSPVRGGDGSTDGAFVAVAEGLVGSCDAVRSRTGGLVGLVGLALGLAGSGEGVGVVVSGPVLGVGAGTLVSGGAKGPVGRAGSPVAGGRRGSTIRAAAPQATTAPTVARSSLRRAARRRTAV
ncbi:hypothetical protein [Streptomyces sp. B93]|uniref:hypothetical protein n=1 Tax=Streptomyces sp. B93 TaxID=2824875 RepID=UPI001B35C632|nr:hypothetical protein [Streptomyces sp. B93]MBQ1089307.1 hypothetical protein [Streptomyces sp. B93]